MHKHISKFLIAPLALAAVACTGAYEDINSNPYEPDDLTPDGYALNSQMNNMAGCVMSSDVNTIQFTDALLGGVLGGYFADANSGFTESFARYNPKNDWSRVFLKSDKIIPTLYANLGQIEAICLSSGQKAPFAIARIIKVAAMSRGHRHLRGNPLLRHRNILGPGSALRFPGRDLQIVLQRTHRGSQRT